MKVTPALLQKFHLGQCSPEENEAVLKWLEADDVFEDLLTDPTDLESRVGKGLWQQLSKNCLLGQEEHQAKSVDIVPVERVKQKSYKWLVFSASVAASIIVCGFLLFRDGWTSLQSVTESKTVIIPYASKGKLTLSDGTVVHLNAGSKLEYPNEFESQERVVKLCGEAFFDVARETDRPFRVVTDETVVDVIGTAFNLTAYPGEQQRLEVMRGAVSIQSLSQRKELVVRAGQSAALDDRREIQYGSSVETDSPPWKDDALLFKDNRLQEVAHVLERLYDVKIQFHDETLQDLRFTGKFESAPLKTVLEDITYVLKIKYNEVEKQIIFNR